MSERKTAPNPFQRQPVTDRSRLAGRAEELDRIKYYLGLTAAGQSPHIAIIGNRGVGKTSLLNAATDLGNDLGLLVVRLDLDEEKVTTSASFWRELYSALILKAAEAGAWGGAESPTFAALFAMLHSGGPVTAANSVLLLPTVFAANASTGHDFECPSSLVEADIRRVLAELTSEGIKGLALLIDEGDCLKRSRFLLQALRNIFQRVRSASMVIAGTPDLFDVVSEVFSPIPRQFFRVDVKPFTSMGDTRELIMRALGADASRIGPTPETMRDLHELCVGEPAEIQLYCHHMYRAVESGETRRMELSPALCKEVVHEYRAASSGNVTRLLDAIEELPQKMLAKSPFLRFRALSAEEMVALETFVRALRNGKSLSTAECLLIEGEVREVLAELHSRGISSSSDRLALMGMPLTGVFWKSLARLPRSGTAQRWTWNDLPLAELKAGAVLRELTTALDGVRHRRWDEASSVAEVFEAISSGGAMTPRIVRTARHIIEMARLAKRSGAKGFVDCRVTVTVGNNEVAATITVPNGEASVVERATGDSMEKFGDVLKSAGVMVTVTGVEGWRNPDDKTVQRVAWTAQIWIDEAEFGELMGRQAADRFLKGDADGAVVTFQELLTLRPDVDVMNNLGYCWVTMGRYAEAVGIFKDALKMKRSLLAEHNLAVALALGGETGPALEVMERCDSTYRSRATGSEEIDVLCMLRLKDTGDGVESVAGASFESALAANLKLLRARPLPVN